MKIGYLRTAAHEDAFKQKEQLNGAGAEVIFEDIGVASSAVFKPAYVKALKSAKPGDELIVTRLDRLASTFGTLLIEVQVVETLGLGLCALEDGISSPVDGEFFRHVRALQGFQRSVTCARGQADTPREIRAHTGGQPALIEPAEWMKYRHLMKTDKAWTLARVARELGVSRQAIYKRLKAEGIRR